MRWALLLLAACGSDPQTPSDATAGAHDTTLGDATPPVAAGCITDVSPGDHTFTCGGLQTDVRIPAACEAPGCGLILELHGDTGNGLLMDGHTNLRSLGEQHGYIVVAPSGPPWPGGPGSTWHASNDAALIAITTQFRDVFRVDPKKIHITGFSRGSFVTWRLLCDHADLFASAAPGGGGDGTDFGEVTCFSNNRVPSRHLPIIFLMGQLDQSVGYPSLVQIRDAAIASYGLANSSTISSDTTYHHDRWSGTDSTTVIETFDHGYATVPDGPFGSAEGHCIAGSTSNPYAVQYAIPCKLPNAFVWGEEVMTFFLAHPMS
jgi:poly(3-hydroxybutyrate) depolymerase